jgi:hypothetical protein
MKLLIPLAYLNEACYLSLNIDEKKFKMVLKIAQEDLEEILGAEFYDQIETQYEPSGGTFTSANETLYEDYLKDYLAWAAYHRFLGFSQSDSTPTGERAFNDENSTLLADIALESKEKNVLKMVARYKNRIINYLELEQSKDSTAFPLWEGCKKGSFGWGISGIERNSEEDKIFSINKAVVNNE